MSTGPVWPPKSALTWLPLASLFPKGSPVGLPHSERFRRWLLGEPRARHRRPRRVARMLASPPAWRRYSPR